MRGWDWGGKGETFRPQGSGNFSEGPWYRDTGRDGTVFLEGKERAAREGQCLWDMKQASFEGIAVKTEGQKTEIACLPN